MAKKKNPAIEATRSQLQVAFVAALRQYLDIGYKMPHGRKSGPLTQEWRGTPPVQYRTVSDVIHGRTEVLVQLGDKTLIVGTVLDLVQFAARAILNEGKLPAQEERFCRAALNSGMIRQHRQHRVSIANMAMELFVQDTATPEAKADEAD